jgi:hypothetical protein
MIHILQSMKGSRFEALYPFKTKDIGIWILFPKNQVRYDPRCNIAKNYTIASKAK